MPDAGDIPDGGTDTGVDAAPPPRGHVVLFAFDGASVNESVDRMIANSVLLSERPGATRVLRYVEYYGYDFMHVQNAIDEVSTTAGRTVELVDLASFSGLAAALPATDVLLVLPQSRTDASTIMTIAAAWRDDLLAFLDDGGVVIVMSSTGFGSPAAHEWRIVAGEGLFTVTYLDTVYMTHTHELIAPADPIGEGVVTPFALAATCFGGSAGGTLVARRTATAVTEPLCPVARHLVW
jgi:hypothetical protein